MLKKVEEWLKRFGDDVLFEEFYFVGGTALSYYLNHRISYDIDFMSLSKLDYARLKTLGVTYGAKYIPDGDATTFKINSGDNIESYKMCFNFEGIKVDFFYPNDPLKTSLVEQEKERAGVVYGGIKIVSLKTVAYLKLLAFLSRSKIRDLFDVMVLLDQGILDVAEIERYSSLVQSRLIFPEFVEQFQDDGTESLDFSDENLYHDEFIKIAKQDRVAYIKDRLMKLFVQKTLDKRET